MSISDFFNAINLQDVALLTLMMVLFSLCLFALTRARVFRDAYGRPNIFIPVLISASVALLTATWAYKANFNAPDVFYNVGVSSDIIYPVLAAVLIVTTLGIIWFAGFGLSLIVLGGGILLLNYFMDAFYDKGMAMLIGTIMVVLGLFFWRRSRLKLMAAKGWVGSKYTGAGTFGHIRSGLMIAGVLTVVLGIIMNNVYLIYIGVGLAVAGFLMWKFFGPKLLGSGVAPWYRRLPAGVGY